MFSVCIRSLDAVELRKQVLSSLHLVVSEGMALVWVKFINIVGSEPVESAHNAILRELYKNIWGL